MLITVILKYLLSFYTSLSFIETFIIINITKKKLHAMSIAMFDFFFFFELFFNF